jgi:very-short-patch-repair endonuclease
MALGGAHAAAQSGLEGARIEPPVGRSGPVADLCIPVDAKPRNADPDAAIARIAARQHGVVSLAQLEQAGVHRQGRNTRLRRGRLHRIHRSVFAVGHRGLSREGHWLAAVLAVGAGAALSHVSAGALWGMLGSRGRDSSRSVQLPIDVTVRGANGSRRGIRVHRSRTLTPDEVTVRLGIPVTTPTRTLIDLHRVLGRPQFAAALRQAEFLGLPLDPALQPDRTRSELEGKLLALCRRHRLPRPEVNVPVGSFTADFLWVDRRLIVEVDGYRAHGNRSAFEADRARDVELRLLGYDVARFTWRQLTDYPRDVARALRQLLVE